MTSRWKVAGIAIEGERINIGGINPWNHEWTAAEEPAVELPHPQHLNQLHQMNVYRVESGGRTITFAAGELSMNVWGFYVPA
jgi:hypothetical protein